MINSFKTDEDYEDLYDDVSIENKQAIETCNIYKNILKRKREVHGFVAENALSARDKFF